MLKNNPNHIKYSSKNTIIITAGGTGGHMYPAESLVWEFNNSGWNIIVISDLRGSKFLKTFPTNIKVYTQDVISLNFRNPFLLIYSIYLLIKGIFFSSYLLLLYKPSIVIGFGGYPTFPTIFSAKFFGFKVVLHEGNAVLGKVNKFFCSKVNAIACGFWPTIAPKGSKLYFTGNPIRKTFLSKKIKPFKFSLTGRLNIVVIGGSQGANLFSNIIPESISKLPISIKKRINIFHQARSSDCQNLKKDYEIIGVNSDVKSFFYNIEDIFSDAHLIIARAGASTISEVLFFGRPLILIPIRNSVFDHQKLNAGLLSKKEAAFCINENECTNDYLTKKILEILINNKLAVKLSSNAKSMAVPEASIKLKEFILKNLNGEVIEFKN